MSRPSDALDYPYPQEQFPSGVEALLGLSDWISPSFYLRKGIELVLSVDPVEWLSGEFAGDWQELSKAGTALQQLGEYAYAVGHDVDRVAADLGDAWSGNAAENALSYFSGLAGAVAGLQTQLAELGDAFQVASAGVKKWADFITDMLGLLLDQLIEIGIAAAATGAFSWTGAGLAIGGAGTAYLAYKATSTWMKIVEAHGYASAAVKGLVGATAGALSTLDLDSSFVLPGAYDNPAVTR